MSFLSAAQSAFPLKIFFGSLLLLLLAVGVYLVRNRQRFFSHAGDPADSYASANLRLWLVVLVWIHAVLLTVLMIIET